MQYIECASLLNILNFFDIKFKKRLWVQYWCTCKYFIIIWCIHENKNILQKEFKPILFLNHSLKFHRKLQLQISCVTLKFTYTEKASKFEQKPSKSIWHYDVSTQKRLGVFFQIFVSFSEYLNFNCIIPVACALVSVVFTRTEKKSR